MTDAIAISDTHLRVALARRTRALQDAAPLMAAIALDMHGGVEDVLANQGQPRWPQLSARTTLPRRRARGTWPGKMLQETGALASSIQPDSGDDWAQVSTNLKKARTLHFGATQGQFGRSRRGGPLPWGSIPARPFMVIAPDTRETVLKRAVRWLAGES